MPNSVHTCTKGGAGVDENDKKYKLLEKRTPAQHVSPNSVKSISHRLQEALSTSGDIYQHHPANKIFKLGEEASGTRPLGAIQDFHQLRQECLSKGILFEDPEFPAQDSSIYPKNKPTKFAGEFEWKRPKEIVKSGDVQLFVDGFSRFDVVQGLVGDCWFIAGIANLAMHPNLFSQVVPEDQSFQHDQYAGIFHFRFWQYGRWVDVVIDDRLPMFEGKLLFARSPEDNEFWSPLLEKAYAKLHGSYEALVAGNLEEVINDFTGRVAEMYLVDGITIDFFKSLLEAQEKGAIMGCAGLKGEVEGLAGRHQYSITRVDYVKHVDKNNPDNVIETPLVRLRNPGGGNSVNLDWLGFVMKEGEWEGPWGDKSPEWNSVSIEEKERLGFRPDLDGEFWLSWLDFQRYFTMFDLCRSNPNALLDRTLNSDEEKWEMSAFEGEWIRGVTSGGMYPEEESYWNNPQYRITLKRPAKENGDCKLIVALRQKFQTRKDTDTVYVGFAIYHLKDPHSSPKPLDANFGENNQPLDIELYKDESLPRSLPFLPLEISCRIKLPPGTYCIIPSTLRQDEEGKFLLRVFSEEPNNMEEYHQQVGFGKTDERVLKQHLELKKIQEGLLESFKEHAGNKADCKKLKVILDSALSKVMPNRGFSEDVCRSIIDLLDTSQPDKLVLKQFETLSEDIATWQVVFSLYDTDGLGYLTRGQLKEALNSAGYCLNNHVWKILLPLYEKEEKITFDDFVMCASLVKASLTSIKS